MCFAADRSTLSCLSNHGLSLKGLFIFFLATIKVMNEFCYESAGISVIPANNGVT